MNPSAQSEMINQTAVISEYGWTKSMIDKFLPEPALKPNPFYKTASPQKLWKRSIVEQAMKSEEFKAAFEKARKRKAAGKAAAQVKYDKLMCEIEEKTGEIRVQLLSPQVLEDLVLRDKQSWYDCLSFERRRDFQNAYDADGTTKTRWAVNYIRHCLTSYDETLFEMAGRVGCHAAYEKYQSAVLHAIAEAYPRYKDECVRQEKRSEMINAMRQILRHSGH